MPTVKIAGDEEAKLAVVSRSNSLELLEILFKITLLLRFVSLRVK